MCIVISISKSIVVSTEHRGNYQIKDNGVPDLSGTGATGRIFQFTNVQVKETVYRDNIKNEKESFDWKSIADHSLVIGFLNPPNNNSIWFDPYQFKYEGSGDYRIKLSGMDRVAE